MLKILIPLTACLSLSSALEAKDHPPTPLRFETLENDYQWDSDLEKARATLARVIPSGMSFWTALDLLEKAGARCAGDQHDSQVARCVYSDWITVHDYNRADLFWTAVVGLKGGKVETLTLDRTVDEK
ncbi:MAG TPA: hypothetical protein VF503_06265 [Sphingobium sp.]|uniref:hypothetical protein n=1 Tax=Sphingobium sp. TaxID=1912891 RepID=UPI002ED5A0FE